MLSIGSAFSFHDTLTICLPATGPNMRPISGHFSIFSGKYPVAACRCTCLKHVCVSPLHYVALLFVGDAFGNYLPRPVLVTI